MKALMRKIKWNSIIDGIACIAIGLVLIFWADISAHLITTVFGGLLVVAGALLILSFFIRGEGAFFGGFLAGIGILVLLIGIWVLTHNAQFQGLIPKMFGIIILISGATNLLQSVSLMQQRYRNWWVSGILALLTLLVGILLIVNAQEVTHLLIRIMGGCLVYNGVSDIWITSRVSSQMKRAERLMEEAVQDASAIDVTATSREE